MNTKLLGPQLTALAVLLLATAILYISQGLTHTIIPLRLGDGTRADLVTAGYFLGFGLGAYWGAVLIRHVGHIRAFGGLLGVVILAILVLPMTKDLVYWVTVRMVHGACIAAAAIVVESWLGGAADARSRGRVLAVYTLAVYGGVGVGPLFLLIYPHTGWEVFNIGAILLCVAAVPMLFWRVEAPAVPDRPRADWRRLVSVSSISLVTAAVAGMAGGSFTALGPVYALSLGLDSGGVGLVMSFTVLVGLVLQWPVGHISDRLDRRRILILVSGVSAFAAATLIAGSRMGLIPVYIFLTIFQGTLYTLYPMALAYANDHLDPDADTTDVASGLLLAYGVGAAAGPALAGGAAWFLGPLACFLLAALGLGSAALFGLWHAGRFPTVPLVEQGPYAVVPHSTPEVFELESRTVPDAVYEAELDVRTVGTE